MIIQKKEKYVAQESSQLVLSLTVQNDPDSPHPLEVTWYKGDNRLSNDQEERYHFSIIHASNNIIIASFRISGVQKGDAGQFSCRIQPGNLSAGIELVVNCK